MIGNTYMSMRKLLTAVTMVGLCGCAQTRMTVESPDGSIAVKLELTEAGVPMYAVDVDGVPFVRPSALGLDAEGVSLSEGFRVKRTEKSRADEVWTQPWGENKRIRDVHNELAVDLTNGDGVELTLRFRVFDDGVGFRYEILRSVQDCSGAAPDEAESLTLRDELTEFRFARDGESWSIPAHYDTYELEYRKLRTSEVEDANTPFTFRTDGGVFGSIHEAALVDFPEMTLRKTGGGLRAALAPDGPQNREFKAVVPGSFKTPWRTIQIGRKAVDLINSSLILNLNEPCKIDDTSWIRPMKYVGVWWGMHLGLYSWGKDARHGATTGRAMQYIDFAAENNIEGVLFEGWNDDWTIAYAHPDFDFTRPAPDFDLEKVLAYAEAKGVQYIIHHETAGQVARYEAQLERDLDFAQEHGIHALKTGYAGWLLDGHYHHSQYGVRHYRKVVEEAARRQIMVDAHEAIKETGLRRTWPNFMTRESARGMEWNAWSKGNSPAHHEILPFTRLLAGPMDYTPGIFDIEYRSIAGNPDVKLWNNVHSSECRVNTTLAKQIADWVVLYSPLQMAADLIENYAGHPAFRFFRDFDADCDASEALQGEIGEYIAIVRRATDRYFYGAVTNEEARILVQPLSFLEPGITYQADIYADAPDADWRTNPYAYVIEHRSVTAQDTLTVRLAPGGGQAIVFRPGFDAR